MKTFTEHRGLKSLTRAVVLECIEKVVIHKDEKLEIIFEHSEREIDTEFSVDLLLSNQRIGNSYIILTSDVTEVSLHKDEKLEIIFEHSEDYARLVSSLQEYAERGILEEAM